MWYRRTLPPERAWRAQTQGCRRSTAGKRNAGATPCFATPRRALAMARHASRARFHAPHARACPGQLLPLTFRLFNNVRLAAEEGVGARLRLVVRQLGNDGPRQPAARGLGAGSSAGACSTAKGSGRGPPSVRMPGRRLQGAARLSCACGSSSSESPSMGISRAVLLGCCCKQQGGGGGGIVLRALCLGAAPWRAAAPAVGARVRTTPKGAARAKPASRARLPGAEVVGVQH